MCASSVQGGDGHHITAPPEDGRGAAKAMELALRDANIGVENRPVTAAVAARLAMITAAAAPATSE